MLPVITKAREFVQSEFGIEVRRVKTRERKIWDFLNEFREMARDGQGDDAEFLKFCLKNFLSSQSQIFQDLFVLYQLGAKRNGFFVEFGATNGISLSNSYLMETEYGWQGVLAEPARAWQKDLQNNRKCKIDLRCVTDHSGDTVRFSEADILELSTMEKWSSHDMHADARRTAKTYDVETVSINDLLATHEVPQDFDYLSIDTEGSELDILSAMNFSAHAPKIITVEHNFTQNRGPIFDLLSRQGYVRKFQEFSMFDDWYVRQS